METDNHILELLEAIRATLDQHTDELREIRGRLGNLEHQYAGLSARFDRMDERLARVERRLDLIEA